MINSISALDLATHFKQDLGVSSVAKGKAMAARLFGN